tara:strand:- start:1648 stop:1968 length:321 start_codon:yes stop_codon:yes gene_type:complete
MKKLDKIDHIAIKVNNIEESLCWYLEKFDCKTIYYDKTWALIRFKNINLALTSNNEHPNHFAIIDNTILNNKDILKHRDGSKSIYIKDINQNYIELITYKKTKGKQ